MDKTTTANNVGGYDYRFLDTPPDNLLCNICHCPSREPYLSECCGHTFCKSCLKQATVCICPMCRSESFTAFANKQADRAVRSLRVFCTNKGKGCQWQGELNNIVNHLQTSNGCQFEEVPCPNNCGVTIQRHCLANHMKRKCPRHKVDCEYCHITGERQFIDGNHQKQCPNFPILCPNKCEVGSVVRSNVEGHIKVCPLEVIHCEFYEVGCEERMARKDQKKHNEQMTTKHLSLSVHQLTGTQDNIANWVVDSRDELAAKIMQSKEGLAKARMDLTAAERKLQKTEIDLMATKRQLEQAAASNEAERSRIREEMNMKFTQMANFVMAKERSAETTKKVYCRKIFCLCFFSVMILFMGYMALFIYAQKKITKVEANLQAMSELAYMQNITELEMELQVMNELAYNITEVEMKLQAMNELVDKQKKNITELKMELQEITLLYEAVFTHNSSQVTPSDVKWAKNLISESTKLSSGREVIPVIVKMSEYSKKYRDDVDWFSDPFYTHPNGYKLCLNVNAAGKNLAAYSTYLSVALYLMKGPYDSDLRWPLSEDCKVTLLNQISNNEHYSHSMSSDYSGQYRVTSGERSHIYFTSNLKYISNTDLYKSTSRYQYLRNDAVYFYIDCTIYSL